METTSVRRSPGGASASPDPSWSGLYRVGGVSAALYVVLIIVPLVLLSATPQPPLSGGAATLQYIASHKPVYLIELVMLKGVFHKGVAYLGIATGAIGIISEVLRPIIGPGYYIYGLLLPIWFVAVGWKLYRLARD
jgi:hypothetical protein